MAKKQQPEENTVSMLDGNGKVIMAETPLSEFTRRCRAIAEGGEPTNDREHLRRITLLLDALDQERQDEASRRKEYAARIEVLTTELLKLRDDIKNGQGDLFTESAVRGKSPAAEVKAGVAAGFSEVFPSPSSPEKEAQQ